jgi:hypothetical protein
VYQTFTFTNSSTNAGLACYVNNSISGYDVANNTCGTSGSTITLAGTSSCTVDARPHPAGAATLGASNGTLSMVCNNSSTVSASMTSTTTAAVAANYANLGGTYSFGSYLVGDNSGATVATATIYAGNAALNGCNFAGNVTLSNPTDFTVVTNTMTNSIPAWGDSGTGVTIRANPKSAGATSSSVTLTCTNGGSYVTNADLTVTGVAPPVIYFSDTTGVKNADAPGNTVDFGTMSAAVGYYNGNLYYSNNSAAADASSCTSTLTGADAPYFPTGANLPTSVYHQQSASVYYQFTPSTLSIAHRTYSATFTTTCTSTTNPTTNNVDTSKSVTIKFTVVP